MKSKQHKIENKKRKKKPNKSELNRDDFAGTQNIYTHYNWKLLLPFYQIQKIIITDFFSICFCILITFKGKASEKEKKIILKTK